MTWRAWLLYLVAIVAALWLSIPAAYLFVAALTFTP